ncbi:MAG TPA: hypothetical protein ENJ56_04495 [Anaerolineae bacterium]|nr:hypothetical protein [Anaerolineae bacterium]
MENVKKRSIFRKVALDRIASPDQLDIVLRIVSPTEWLLYLAIGLVLLAFIGWSLFGTLVQRITRPALVESAETILFLPVTDAVRVQVGMPVSVIVAGQPETTLVGTVAEIGTRPLTETELLSWIQDDRWLTHFAPEAATVLVRVRHKQAVAAVATGSWATASIDIAQLRPISFLLPTQ